MKKSLLILSLFASLVLVGCGFQNQNVDCATGDVCTLPAITSQQTSLTGVAQQAIQAIKTQDFATLATLASINGVRFTPYEYVDTVNNVVLPPEQIQNAGIIDPLALPVAYTRGAYDGSGDPINLGILPYWDKFVYDVDFANAPIQQWNQIMQKGNIINNITTVYAGKQVIEYHFTGFDQQYEGMDRRSLFLVFDQENGEWKLIAVVHGQWTI